MSFSKRSVSRRYAAIVAILDDPVNRAIVLREVYRREELRIVVPYRLGQGEKSLFDLDDLIYRVAGEDPRPLAKVVRDEVYSGLWAVAGDDEVGPFPTREIALSEASKLLSGRGYTVLDVSPWGEDEENAYPMPD